MRELLTKRVDPRPLALTRILVGVAALLMVREYHGVLDRIADGGLSVPAFGWSPDVTGDYVTLFGLIGSLSAVALILGLYGRVAALLTSTAGAVVLATDQQLYSNHLLLLVLLALYLSFSDPDHAWGVRQRGVGEPVPLWPQLLLMAQVSTMYSWTGIAKMTDSWLSGRVLEASWSGRLPFPESMFPALAVFTIAVELFLAIGLWFRRTRGAAFVIGFGLHTAIVLSLIGGARLLMSFGLLTMSTYPLFLQRGLEHRTVIWDRNRSVGATWVRLFKKLDWFQLHDFRGSEPAAFTGTTGTEAQEMKALQLVAEGGEHHQGFDAVRKILEACPATFLIAPVLGLPPVRVVGGRVYARVAARGSRDTPVGA